MVNLPIYTLSDKVNGLRELPRSEWDRLAGTELGPVIHLMPESAKIAVVEIEGQIVGCWSMTPLWHAEGVWIHPEHRGGTVGRKLLRWMYTTASQAGARMVLTGSLSPVVTGYIERLGGTEAPGQTYVLPVKD